MTPPDSNPEKQRRRHWGPLLGMALAVAVGVGVIFYWIADEIVSSPQPQEEESETLTPEKLNAGDVDVPDSEPTEKVTPQDKDVKVQP